MDVIRKVKHKTRIRTRYRSLKSKIKTAMYIYRTSGFFGLVSYIKTGFVKRLHKEPKVKNTGDVLIVSIDEPLLDRYRTDHMVEALESTGVSVGKVYYYDLKPEHIKRYNVFIFYRCPWMVGFEDIFDDIRKKNKVSIYAVDDLVIDTKYTNNLPVLESMTPEDRAMYDDGVRRHNKLMMNCDYAIATTECLAEELRTYKNLKEVFVDRNSMSEEMIYYANKALKEVAKDDNRIVIGYFSGTATHNEDFQMITPVLIRILKKYSNVYIKLAGKVDVPEVLKDYKDRLIFMPYVDWRQLPFELRECHINLSPLVDTLFNRAKSEIKWAESALVEVPVVASDMGAFREAVEDGITGVLVKNTEDDWYEGVCSLIANKEKRENIAKQAREYILSNYTTTGERAVQLRDFIQGVTPNIIAFGGVSLSALSGGNMVAKKHMDLLREAGNIVYGVESMAYHKNDQWQKLNQEDDKKYDIFRVNSKRRADKIDLKMNFDRFVATFWASVDMVDRYQYITRNGKKMYLVQNMEADFYALNDKKRRQVLATYRNHRIEPVTISRWCQDWLKSTFGRSAKYAPNCIDIDNFSFVKRDFKNRKIKILIEGDSSSDYKRVDESFTIANKLDPDKYEVSYMSYNAAPKDWYRVDNVYMKVPYSEVSAIYTEHDILIKSSVLESFSYPPLEMMATGGVPVLVKNDGNSEYVQDGVNALCYEPGDIDGAVALIEGISGNESKFNKLAAAGRKTAESRSWSSRSGKILSLYK